MMKLRTTTPTCAEIESELGQILLELMIKNRWPHSCGYGCLICWLRK